LLVDPLKLALHQRMMDDLQQKRHFGVQNIVCAIASFKHCEAIHKVSCQSAFWNEVIDEVTNFWTNMKSGVTMGVYRMYVYDVLYPILGSHQ
jgi:hypothetical protein